MITVRKPGTLFFSTNYHKPVLSYADSVYKTGSASNYSRVAFEILRYLQFCNDCP